MKLIEASNLLESIFSSVLLINFSYGSFVLCLICFQLVVLDDPTQILIYGGVLLLIFLQIYLLCYHGQKLIDSNTNISNEIYDANWYSIKDLKVKRMIVLVMRMSQSPKIVRGCDFVDICADMTWDQKLRLFDVLPLYRQGCCALTTTLYVYLVTMIILWWMSFLKGPETLKIYLFIYSINLLLQIFKTGYSYFC